MNNQTLPETRAHAQPVQFHYPTSREHFDAWVDGVRKSLAVVRVKRSLPQTRADHAFLAEREARYKRYLKQAEAVQ